MGLTTASNVLTLKFGNPERKQELIESAARQGVPLNHFVWEIYLEWRTRRETQESYGRMTIDAKPR